MSQNNFSKPIKLTLEKGIEQIYSSDNYSFNIHSSKGIGSLFLNLPTGEKTTLNFFYENSLSFNSFEKVNIINTSNGLDLTEKLIASGRILITGGKIKITVQDSSINWRIEFIDYFRN